MVEVEINNTPTHSDDLVSFFPNTPMPARIRIANPSNTWGGVQVDAPVLLTNIGPCGTSCGTMRFATSTASPALSNLPLVLPRSGAWVPFVVRGNPNASSLTWTDAVLEVRENRADGNVLARHGLSANDVNVIWTQSPAAILEVGRTAISLDDYLTWAPTGATVRLVTPNSLTSGLPVVLRNAAATPGADPEGRVVFGLPAVGGGPPPPGGMSPTLQLVLPQTGAGVAFYVAGEFGRPSMKDKDAIIEVFNPGEPHPRKVVIEHIGVMVRVRKDANALTAQERDRFLNAVHKLDSGVNAYDRYTQIWSQAGGRGYSINPAFALSSPSFLPWHRLLILRFERELQGLDPSVTLPYWRYDQPAPSLFTQDFMGVSQTGNPVVLTAATNPLQAWGIRRMSSFAPNQSPASTGPAACRPLTEPMTLSLGSQFRTNSSGATGGFMSMEWLTSNVARHAAAGDCLNSGPTGWLATHPPQDPLFFLLQANTDRLWARWQRQNGRFDPAIQDSYGVIPCGGTPSGQCLTDPMWPWNDSAAPGGSFPQVVGRDLLPRYQPSPSDALGLDLSYWPAATGQWSRQPAGLGYSYDDTPYSL